MSHKKLLCGACGTKSREKNQHISVIFLTILLFNAQQSRLQMLQTACFLISIYGSAD
jgi:hypothetical protein